MRSRLTSLAALLITTLAAAAQQPLDPAHYPTLAALLAACGTSCTITATNPQTFADRGTVRVPAGAHLVFTAAALWTLPSATLDFAGAAPSAPAQQIFAGPHPATHLSEARPEWFAAPLPPDHPRRDSPDTPVYPDTALRAAYIATDPQATISLSAAIYLSPFRTPQTLYDSPRTFLGVSRPTLDSATAPTALGNGTIIAGTWLGHAAIIASHLGFDAGPLVTHRFFHDHKDYGLFLFGNGERNTTAGTRLTDIAVLTTDAPSQHSLLLEGQRDILIDGLDLTTLGGTHGLILKSSDVTVHNFRCTGASSDCLLLKSDYITDHDGLAEHLLLDGVTITSLHQPGDTGGIVLDARWDAITAVTLRNLTEQGTSFGIASAGSWFHSVHDLTIENWTATDITGPCLESDGTHGLTLTHFVCAEHPATTGEAAAITLEGKHSLLTAGTLSCVGDCASRSAIADTTAAQLAAVTATGFGGGLLTRATPPLTAHTRKLLLKEHLRILYTMVATRLSSWPARLALLLLLFFLALAALFRRKRNRTSP